MVSGQRGVQLLPEGQGMAFWRTNFGVVDSGVWVQLLPEGQGIACPDFVMGGLWAHC